MEGHPGSEPPDGAVVMQQLLDAWHSDPEIDEFGLTLSEHPVLLQEHKLGLSIGAAAATLGHAEMMMRRARLAAAPLHAGLPPTTTLAGATLAPEKLDTGLDTGSLPIAPTSTTATITTAGTTAATSAAPTTMETAAAEAAASVHGTVGGGGATNGVTGADAAGAVPMDAAGLLDRATKVICLLSGFHSTAWNARKQLIRQGQLGSVVVPLPDELRLAAVALTKHPKSEFVWKHRRWLIQMCALPAARRRAGGVDGVPDGVAHLGAVGDGAAARAPARGPVREAGPAAGDAAGLELLRAELVFCHGVLPRYPKNYHCWVYRQWLLHQAVELSGGASSLAGCEPHLKLDLRLTSEWLRQNPSDHGAHHHLGRVANRLVAAVAPAAHPTLWERVPGVGRGDGDDDDEVSLPAAASEVGALACPGCVIMQTVLDDAVSRASRWPQHKSAWLGLRMALCARARLAQDHGRPRRESWETALAACAAQPLPQAALATQMEWLARHAGTPSGLGG